MSKLLTQTEMASRGIVLLAWFESHLCYCIAVKYATRGPEADSQSVNSNLVDGLLPIEVRSTLPHYLTGVKMYRNLNVFLDLDKLLSEFLRHYMTNPSNPNHSNILITNLVLLMYRLRRSSGWNFIHFRRFLPAMWWWLFLAFRDPQL